MDRYEHNSIVTIASLKWAEKWSIQWAIWNCVLYQRKNQFSRKHSLPPTLFCTRFCIRVNAIDASAEWHRNESGDVEELTYRANCFAQGELVICSLAFSNCCLQPMQCYYCTIACTKRVVHTKIQSKKLSTDNQSIVRLPFVQNYSISFDVRSFFLLLLLRSIAQSSIYERQKLLHRSLLYTKCIYSSQCNSYGCISWNSSLILFGISLLLS